MGPRERHRIIIIIIAFCRCTREEEKHSRGEKKRERERERDKEREKVIRTFFMCACVFMRVCELWSVCVSKYRSLRSVVCTRNEKRFAK